MDRQTGVNRVMKTSIIIPCYNAEDTIGEQLQALVGQHCSDPWEVLVVDNRCTDSSMAVVERFQQQLPNLRIIEANDRQGQPFAVNTGVQAAKGENVLFCDADDVIGEGYLAAMNAALDEHDFVGCGFEETRLNERWVQESHSNLQKSSLSRYRYPPFLSHSGGGVMGVKRALFQQFNGFDESLPILHDTDFCWRLQLAGVTLTFVSNAVVHIRYRSSLRDLYRQSRNYAEFNVLLYKRYRPQGMPELTLKTSARKWLSLTSNLRFMGDQIGRARLVWQLGWCVGRLRGSIKHRVFAL